MIKLGLMELMEIGGFNGFLKKMNQRGIFVISRKFRLLKKFCKNVGFKLNWIN